MKVKLLIIVFCTTILLGVEYDEGYLLETPESYYGRIEYLSSLEKIKFIRGTIVRGRDVFISWIKLDQSDVTYTIYRNTRIMDTYVAFETAIVVGEVVDRDSFLDTSIAESNVYYYAVTTKKSGYTEDRNLEANKSYLARGFTVNTGRSRSTVYSLTTQRYSDGIFLRWKNPSNYRGNLFVYRSDEIIDSNESLNRAVMIKKITNVEQYRDRNVGSHNFYYAVLMEGRDNRPARIFSPGNNFTGSRQTTKPLSESTDIMSLSAELSQDGVLVRWSFPKHVRGSFLLYRLDRKPEVRDDARSGVLLKRFDISESFYYDTRGGKRSYYAIIPVEGGQEKRSLIDGVDRTAVAEDYKTAVPSERSSVEPYNESGYDADPQVLSRIDALVREFYRTKKYRPIINQLVVIGQQSRSEAERAKAYFFAGRVCAESGDYRRALNYLYRDDVQKYYTKEAKFWQDYCLTKLK
ncbi:MAG: hypothetical protein PF637_03205 [Spirochaetes bacterium]|nr:hypothetical protein [Spirochaetota bacterium]